MIDVCAQEGLSPSQQERAWIARGVEAALRCQKRTGGVTVQLVTAGEIRRLNAAYRGVDSVTDVLSFPASEGEAIAAPPDGYLGDLAVCLSRAAEQAERYGHPLERELAFLAVHGTLHLLGFDHMTAPQEEQMRARQREIMKELGLEIREKEPEKDERGGP